MTPATSKTHPARGATWIALFAALWLFISPWIYGAYGDASAWNSWIIGALIFLLALLRRSHPATIRLSWINFILGIWIIASPWVYGYTGSAGRLINSLCVGFIIFCAAMAAANSDRMSHDTTSTSSPY